ncbi:MAG TPA: alpha/beta family hydrolase [Actinomycetota bacterium]|jgi:dienelactone hydrolase|nr:alpha/beta family hydrolase [Actinomycetota bacterium]
MDSRAIRIRTAGAEVDGDLVVPKDASGIVVFAHGSGSSRHSRRNQAVARHLQSRGLATLLMDLLTADEEAIDMRTAEFRFDIPLLGERLVAAIDALQADTATSDLRAGCFGASTGAAAALIAAAGRPEHVAAVVSRGGRPDLAGPHLDHVQAPTLLIVGERDPEVVELNEQAAARLNCEWKLEIVPAATHLFEERGALEVVAQLAGDWFVAHLQQVGARR